MGEWIGILPSTQKRKWKMKKVEDELDYGM